MNKLIALIPVVAYTLMSCGRREPLPAKPPLAVVQTVAGQQVRNLSDDIVIRAINRDGTVLLGARWMSPASCAAHARARYHLEGAARVNDPVFLITYLELQRLENGEVRTVITKRAVRSKFNKVLESRFQEPKG